MFKYIGLKEQNVLSKKENEKLREIAAKAQSDIDYIAMMADIDLDTEGENENEEI